MIAFVMAQAVPMQFASGWHVENRVLWIVIGVLFILLLVAAYIIVRTRLGNAESRSRRDAQGPR
jgi:flagellar basal body-associated protein FliL